MEKENSANLSEQKLRALFSAITDVVLVLNSEGRYLEIAPTSPSLLYKPPDEVIGKTVYEIFSKEQADYFMQGITHTLDFGITTNVEYVLNIGGKDLYFEAKICPLTSDTVLVVARDITERKKYENVLQKSEEIFRLMTENSGDILLRRSADGIYQYVSPSCRSVLGYEPEELVGHSINEFIHSEDLDLVINANKATAERGVISRVSYRSKRKDGEYIWVETISRATKDPESGRLLGINAASRDITMQKRIESALLESESRYRELFDNTKSCVAVYEAKDNGNDFIFKEINKRVEQVEKVKKENIIGKSVLEIFPGVREFGLFDVFKRVWETGKPESFPLKLYKDVRVSGWKENYVYRLNSREIAAVYDDLTDLKLAEEKLRISEMKFRRLFESSKDGILILDADTGVVEDVNPLMLEMLGYAKEEFLKKKIWELVFFRDIFVSKDEFSRIQDKEYVRFEHMILHKKDGRHLEVEFISNAFDVDSGKVIQCNIRDISGRQ